ncbi:MAG: hypothetical protein KGJ86_17830, partial [Chloroflexota bacterium]|nr:hypothetical protein [Chloroflexota bacterium]
MSSTRRALARELLSRLEAIEQAEEDTLRTYWDGTQNAPDPGVRFLMDLILEDEQRHSRLLASMAMGIRHSLEDAEGRDPLPAIRANREAMSEILLQTERFLEVEKDGLRTLEELGKGMRWDEPAARPAPASETSEQADPVADWMERAPLTLVLETMIDD